MPHQYFILAFVYISLFAFTYLGMLFELIKNWRFLCGWMTISFLSSKWNLCVHFLFFGFSFCSSFLFFKVKPMCRLNVCSISKVINREEKFHISQKYCPDSLASDCDASVFFEYVNTALNFFFLLILSFIVMQRRIWKMISQNILTVDLYYVLVQLHLCV